MASAAWACGWWGGLQCLATPCPSLQDGDVLEGEGYDVEGSANPRPPTASFAPLLRSASSSILSLMPTNSFHSFPSLGPCGSRGAENYGRTGYA